MLRAGFEPRERGAIVTRLSARLCAVRHRDDVAVASLLARQLVGLPLDDDDRFGVGDVIEPVQDRLGALDLREGFRGERPELMFTSWPSRKYGNAMQSASAFSAGI
jgi:hypothetical protein